MLRDDKQAIKWLRKAAEQGNAGAQWRLGGMYAEGTGVLKSMSQAKFWINKAYENPDADNLTINLSEKAWNGLELWKY